LNYFVFKDKGELENGSLTLRGGGGFHIKRTGMLAGTFEKFSEKYQDPLVFSPF